MTAMPGVVQPAFVCPLCWRPSQHPMDREEGYCNACHWWTARPDRGVCVVWLAPDSQWRTEALPGFAWESFGDTRLLLLAGRWPVPVCPDPELSASDARFESMDGWVLGRVAVGQPWPEKQPPGRS